MHLVAVHEAGGDFKDRDPMRVLSPIRRRRFTPVRNWGVPITYTLLALLLGFLIPQVDHRILGTKLVAVSVNNDTAIQSPMASGITALAGITFGDETLTTSY